MSIIKVINEKYINELIQQKYIAKKYSDDNKLYLLNYTNKCIYDKKWNKYTLNNRGHVYENGTNKLIANPFSKFFNLSELSVSKSRNLLKKTNYKCYEKIDGSLGIIYNYEGEWRFNTRGSFNSEQSIKAKEIFFKYYRHLHVLGDNLTLLVEIIYPENRIIIDYKDQESLILLAIYDRDTGDELKRGVMEMIANTLKLPIVKSYNLTFDEMFKYQKLDSLDKEGFVIRFTDGYRVKIKSKKYFQIARLMNNMTPKNIWENMVNGKVKIESLEVLPEEFRNEVDTIVLMLESQHSELKNKIMCEFKKTMLKNPTRKEIGLNKKLNHTGALFSLLDNKIDKFNNYIWKHIKPKKILEK